MAGDRPPVGKEGLRKIETGERLRTLTAFRNDLSPYEYFRPDRLTQLAVRYHRAKNAHTGELISVQR
jgi:hypothetical protein